jgi:hypothetical protein
MQLLNLRGHVPKDQHQLHPPALPPVARRPRRVLHPGRALKHRGIQVLRFVCRLRRALDALPAGALQHHPRQPALLRHPRNDRAVLRHSPREVLLQDAVARRRQYRGRNQLRNDLDLRLKIEGADWQAGGHHRQPPGMGGEVRKRAGLHAVQRVPALLQGAAVLELRGMGQLPVQSGRLAYQRLRNQLPRRRRHQGRNRLSDCRTSLHLIIITLPHPHYNPVYVTADQHLPAGQQHPAQEGPPDRPIPGRHTRSLQTEARQGNIFL